jgi:glutaredoxin 3
MITLYSKPSCPYCVQAKNFLDQHGLAYTAVDVTQDAAALRFIKEERGHTTVPQLYVGATLLVEGGYTGLRDLGIDALRERLAAHQPPMDA